MLASRDRKTNFMLNHCLIKLGVPVASSLWGGELVGYWSGAEMERSGSKNSPGSAFDEL